MYRPHDWSSRCAESSRLIRLSAWLLIMWDVFTRKTQCERSFHLRTIPVRREVLIFCNVFFFWLSIFSAVWSLVDWKGGSSFPKEPLFDHKNKDSKFMYRDTFSRSTVSNLRINICSCDSFHSVLLSQSSWSGWYVPGTNGLTTRCLSFRNDGTHVANSKSF
jgi:hypothetical protein